MNYGDAFFSILADLLLKVQLIVHSDIARYMIVQQVASLGAHCLLVS